MVSAIHEKCNYHSSFSSDSLAPCLLGHQRHYNVAALSGVTAYRIPRNVLPARRSLLWRVQRECEHVRACGQCDVLLAVNAVCDGGSRNLLPSIEVPERF